jgi:putative hydrolase of the HAD superfamily
MQSATPRVIFFDIGGVLLTNGWGHQSRQAAAQLFQFDYGEMNAQHEFIFNIYEIGKITLDAYLDTTLFYRPRDFTREDVKAFMFAQSQELPGMLPWLAEWKKAQRDGLKFFSLNNEGRELNDYRIKKFKLHRCFDAFVSSCEVGMRKPDPGIFQLAMGLAQATPEECLYFDDRLMLVEAARSLGIRAQHHTSFEETKCFLEQQVPYGVEEQRL